MYIHQRSWAWNNIGFCFQNYYLDALLCEVQAKKKTDWTATDDDNLVALIISAVALRFHG